MKDFITAAERIEDQRLTDECYLRAQRSRAVEWLGQRWRGMASCTHRYTDSSGREVRELYPMKRSARR